jgi:hypothetical protein
MKRPSPLIWIVVVALFAGAMVAMNLLGNKINKGSGAAVDAPAAGGGHDHDGDGKSDH